MTTVAPEASAVAKRAALPSPYRHLSAGERYIHRTRDGALLALLERHGVESLAGRRMVELGCGEGALVRSLLYYGAEARLVRAVEVSARKVRRARSLTPEVAFAVADIGLLPYADASFDVAFAFTLFSSVRDEAVRRQGARETMRVLRPGGLLVVYDFQVNPTNRRARPLREAELRALFAPRQVEVARVTLAPPIARLLRGRRSVCAVLERVPFLRTHLLAAIEKEA